MEKLIRALESSFARSDLPEVRPGDTVRVYVKVKETRIHPKTRKPEEKVRLQVYEGVVIAKRGKGAGRSIVVRKISAGIGVERIFPLLSPSVDRIEIVKRAKVRRAKLGYLRGRIGRHAKLKDRRLSPEELNVIPTVAAEPVQEEPPETPALDVATEAEKTPEVPADTGAEEITKAPAEIVTEEAHEALLEVETEEAPEVSVEVKAEQTPDVPTEAAVNEETEAPSEPPSEEKPMESESPDQKQGEG